MHNESNIPKESIIRNYLAFFGVMLVLFGLAGLVYSTYPLGTRRVANPVGGPGPLLQLELPTKLRASETGVVRVNYEFYAPPDVDSSGQVTAPVVYEAITITLRATSFDVAPPSDQPIVKRVKEGVPYEWTWIIRPTQVGQHYIVLEFTGIWGSLLTFIASDLGVDQLPANSLIMSTLSWSFEQRLERSKDPEYVLPLVIPISVVDVLGLTAVQARVMSSVVTFLGSGLCVTWLYEQWQKRRSGKAKKQRPSKRRRWR